MNVQPLYGITMGLTHIIPNTTCYGECMELYEIRGNPMVKDIRAHLAEILLLLWVNLIWELMPHNKAIKHPHISHRLSHTISIFGPCMSHINSFGKGCKKKCETLRDESSR